MKIKLLHVSVLLMAGCILWLPSSVLAEDEDAFIPFARGNYWIFQGTVKYLVPDPAAGKGVNKPAEQTLIWRAEVTEVIRVNKSWTVASVKGWPDDLAWYEPGKKRGDYVFVRSDDGRYYELSGEEAARALKLAHRGQGTELSRMLKDCDPLIEPPLTENKRYAGEPANLERGMYCRVVDFVAPFSAAEIKGAPEPAKERQVFTVSERTNPDRETFSVVLGIGVVSYQYVHHGTLSEVDVRLIEVHLEKP